MLDFRNLNYECDCGKTHFLETEILFSKGSINRLCLLLKKYYSVSRIVIVYDKAVSFYAQKVLEILVNNGFEISEICYEKLINPVRADSERLLNLPDDVRFMLAIGGGSISNVVRYSSSVRKNGYGIIATSPSTDSYLDNACIFNNKKIICSHPKFVILDEDFYYNAPEYLISSGIACVLNCYLSIFKYEYNSAVYKQKYCKTITRELKELLNSFLINYEKSSTPYNILMEVLLKISLARCYLNSLDSSADSCAFILSKNSNSRFYGENLFLSCYTIINLYKCFLEGYKTDTLIPADYVKGIKLLNLKLNGEYNYSKEKFREYKDKNITSIGFLINEYNEDFLSFINKIDTDSFQKTFRRCYFDAGYWLKRYISASELLSVVSLSGLLNENTLHGYLKETGFMEEML